MTDGEDSEFSSDKVVNNEITNAVVKPLRGPSRPLGFAIDDFDYIKSSDVEVLPGTFEDKVEILGTDLGSSDSTALQWIDMFNAQVRAIWEAYRVPELSPEDYRAHIDDVIGGWLRPFWGDDRSFYARVNYGRVPSKLAGRKGTRRAWKRAHPPKRVKWTWVGPGVIELNQPLRRIEHTITLSK